jgi:hypothetical protein
MRPIRKVRVLMLLENNPYPQDDRVRREAETLAAAGYHVRLICPARKDQQNYETINGVEVYRYPAPLSGRGFGGYVAEYGYAMAASLVISWIIFLRHGFDIIHAANPPDTFASLGCSTNVWESSSSMIIMIWPLRCIWRALKARAVK